MVTVMIVLVKTTVGMVTTMAVLMLNGTSSGSRGDDIQASGSGAGDLVVVLVTWW